MQMYFVAVLLPEVLNEEIFQYKQWMQEKFGCKVALKSPAHITIIPPCWTDEKNEDAIKVTIKSIVTSTACFNIQTNHFSSFGKRTLFINVKENTALQTLKKNTDKAFARSKLTRKIDSRPFHPHITIATRDLHKAAFDEAWTYFGKQKFEKEFTAKGLSLLKHNGATWDVVFTALFSMVENPKL